MKSKTKKPQPTYTSIRPGGSVFFSSDGDVSGNNGSSDYWVVKLR